MPDLLSIVWWRNFYSKTGRAFGWGCLIIFAVPLVIGFGWNQYGGQNGRRHNADSNTVIALVNGEPITEAQFRNAIPTRTGSGEDSVKNEGAAMNQLVAATVLRQMADKYKVKVSDAEVDRKIKEEREQVLGKNSTDTQWEDFLSQYHGGISPSDYRDQKAKDTAMLAAALLEKFKAMEAVTPEDIKKQNQEVKARIVQIGYGRQPFADPKKAAKLLTEEQAKKLAEGLLAKARGGADFAALAKANSTDFTKQKGGDIGFMPEYRKSPNPMGQGAAQEMLASSYGKDFAAAVHKTAVGQVTELVKTSMFGSTGYAFAKVETRRDAPAPPPDPKNPTAKPATPDVKAITESIKQERATEKLGNEFKAGFKTARVSFKPEGAEAAAYYHYAKVEERQSQADQARMMAQFGQPSEEPLPDPLELERDRAIANAELEAQFAKRPTDSALALVVAKSLKTKMDLAPSDKKAALRERLITLDQTALKGVENQDLRFELGDLYRDKGDLVNADAVYQKISHLMDIAPGYDTATLTKEQTARKRLVTGLQAIKKPDEAELEQLKLAKIAMRLADAQRKEAEERQKTQQPGGMIAPGKSAGGSLSIPAPKSRGTRPK